MKNVWCEQERVIKLNETFGSTVSMNMKKKKKPLYVRVLSNLYVICTMRKLTLFASMLIIEEKKNNSIIIAYDAPFAAKTVAWDSYKITTEKIFFENWQIIAK